MNINRNMLELGTIEAEEENPGGDSDEDNLDSLAQLFSDIALESNEREDNFAEARLESIMRGPLDSSTPPQAPFDWNLALKPGDSIFEDANNLDNH